jgi:hypothetical protein
MAQHLISLLLCDATVRGPDGKTTIYGVFDIIYSKGFPARHPQFSVYWKIYSAELGKVSIQILKPDGSRLLTTEPLQLEKSDVEKHEGAFSFGGVEFPTPGDYKVIVLFNEAKEIGSEVLKIIEYKP